jgi:hypothetical protein
VSRTAVFVLLLVLGAGWTPRGSAETKRKSGDRSCPSRVKQEAFVTGFEVAVSLVTGRLLNYGSNERRLKEINLLACFLLEGSRGLPGVNLEMPGYQYYPLRDFSQAQYAKAKRIARSQHPGLANIRLPSEGIDSVEQGERFLEELIKKRFPPGTKKLKFTYQPTREP